MNQRERAHEQVQPPAPEDAAAGTPPGTNLEATRDAAKTLLAAADDAINKVLSTNSEQFNQSVRQEGGQ